MDFEKIIEYVYENSEFVTKLLVSWVPTLFFALGVLISTLVGIRRGGRKSVVLLIHSVAIFTLCITLFLLLVDVKVIDALLLQLINLFTGSETGLQELLGISIECETLKEVILESVLKIAEDMGDIGIIFRENGAYILTIIDLVYRIVFGLVLCILYFVLVFIMYLIYLLFYNTRRYIKKRNKKFQDGKVESPYLKKRWLGGIIGFSRGLVGGLVTLSFIGSLYFVIAGGTGENEYIDYDFGDPNINLGYEVITSIGEYGSEGIFKVLNMVKDKEKTPYYLFAADLIFQGGLNDIENNINEDIYFRKEFATYVGFARDTLDLLLKYDDKQLVTSMLSGDFEGDILDELLIIMSNSGFQEEFTHLISTFDSDTYIINLGASFINSFMANIDSMVELGDAGEILKILFKPGHLSESIPYERDLLAAKNDALNPEDSKYKLAYIGINDLIKQEDITNVLGVLFTAVSLINNEGYENLLSDADSIIYVIRSILPYIKNFSILSDSSAKKLDPVLKRVYSFAEYKLLSVSDDQTTFDLARNTKMYEDESNISWIDEINSLLDTSEDLIILAQNVIKSSQDKEFIEIISDIFDDENKHYNTNMQLLDNIINNIGSSQLLGEILSTKVIYTTISGYFSAISPNGLPTDISYTNKLDENGQIIEYGEVYNVLAAIRAVAGNKENFESFNKLSNLGDDALGTIKNVFESLDNSKYNDLTVFEYLSKSVILRAALSGVFSNDSLEISIYIDDSALDRKYIQYKIVSEEELLLLFDIIPEFVDIMIDFTAEEEEETNKVEKIINIVKGKSVDKILTSKIVEGTLSSLLVTMLGDASDFIIVPNSIVRVSNQLENSEVREIINIIKDDVININDLLSENADYLEIFTTLNESKINSILNSKILYYSLSNVIISNMIPTVKIVVPQNCKVRVLNENIKYIVEKTSLVKTLSNITGIVTKDETNEESPSEIDFNKMIKERDKFKDDYILLSTIIYYITDYMYNNPGNDIVIPKKLLDEGLNIGDNDYKQTSWNNELMNLLDALDALQIFNNDDFDILNVQFDNIKLNHEMIDKLSASIIVSATMYNKLNTDAIVIPHIALDSRREYILDTELKALLINLVDNKILFGCAENEEVDLLKITKPNINNITTDVIRNFAKSDILEATMINIITHKGDETNEGNVGSAVNIPQAYDDDSTRKALEEKKTKNIWFVNDEMIKLADALDALDIHNLKIKDPSTITDKFKYDYMHSAFAKDNTKTNLHVVMSSAIISSTISKTIIDTLKPEMIYDDIKTHRSIYNSSKTVESYTETEIENLLFGLKKLGIDDLSSINQNEVYDRIKNSAKDIDNTLIDDIWNSRLLAGVVTTQIRNKEDVEGSIIHHHDKAYEKDINIYRSIEIKTLLKLLGNSDVENIELKNILLRNIKNSIQNSEGKVDSYILLKTISDNLYKNEASNGIIIPNKCFNREQGYINPDELANLINGLEILGYENCDISLLEIGTTKSQEQYKEAFNSIIIRATVTSLIDIRSEKGKQYSTAIYNSHIEIDRDCRNVSKKIAIINSDELLNIVKSFKALIGNNNTSLSYTFNIEQLAMMDKEVLDDILSSDLFHIYVSDNLIELYKKLPQATEPTDENFVDVVYLLTLIEKSNHEILTVNQIVEILNFKKILV